MAKHHILTLFAASLLSQPLLAAAPVLGPEVPLVPGIELRSAAYDQTAPAAASNGNPVVIVPRAAGEGTASVEIAWNGSESVPAWVERGKMKAIRDDANGGAPRAFMRALARQPVSRNRAVAR